MANSQVVTELIKRGYGEKEQGHVMEKNKDWEMTAP